MSEEPHEVQTDPVVLEGDDRDHVEPVATRDPYTPEPGARPGERRAFRVLGLTFLALAIVAAILIWAAVR
jgi:hypothetical protein